MYIQSWLRLVLCLAQIAFVHSHGIGFLGGSNALLPRVPTQHPPHMEYNKRFEIGGVSTGALLTERAEKLVCGAVNGSCPAGYCCSIGGFCGKDFHYCSGPACQLSYGDSCDGNISPLGTTTKDVARPHIGNVSYGGVGIYTCSNKNHVALTFDDGPYIYTSDVLDILAQYNAKATFFITGNNMGKGSMDNESTGYPQIIQRMHREGHQIASHTWTHQNLSGVTQEQRENQMHFNEMAFRNVLGFFPTYMRPPYSEANNATQKMLFDMGYHIIYYNIISNDYNNNSPELIQNSKDEINTQFATVNVSAGYPANFIEISHDIHEQTAHNLTKWTLDRMLALGFGTSITVGECLNDPPENWYRNASGAPSDAAVSRPLAEIKPTAIPSSGPSSSVSSSFATATGVGLDGMLGISAFGIAAARVLY